MSISISSAKGSIFGAFIGDAAGATLEFLGYKPLQPEVDAAMKMVGGGVWRVAPGQITDDSELAMCILNALSESNHFDREKIAQNYLEWLHSPPFDIGGTTSTAFSAGRTAKDGEIAQAMHEESAYHNQWSKANGSLMRCTPLAIWSTRVSAEKAAEYARLDSQLSHPNPSCQHAVAAYVLAVRHLCFHPKDGSGAFAVAKQYLDSQEHAEVIGWLRDAESNINYPYHPEAGFVRIAFTHAFRHLKLGSSFQDAIAETLLGGGDSDTNACIVGGLVGAHHGFEALPNHMVQAIRDCNTSHGRPRPLQYHTRNLDQKIMRLLA